MKVFSKSRVITFIQSLTSTYLIFNFDMYSFVITIANYVRKAVDLINTTKVLEFISDIVEVPMADPNPIKISVTINKNFFLFKLLYFFL